MYHAEDNPNGYIPLSIAENRLSVDLIAARYSRVQPPPSDYFGYGAPQCDEKFSIALANFLTRYVTKHSVPVNPRHVVATCGASGAIDQLVHNLCDAGDAILIVAPGYQGFDYCAGVRCGVRVIPAQCSESNSFRANADIFEAAWKAAGGAESRIRAVLLSSPGNPSGEVIKRDALEEIIAWARRRGIHVISDEVYALSVFGKGGEFVSAFDVLQGELGDDVHLIWALSKDFCGSGLRVGAIVSQNSTLLARLAHTTFFCDVSRPVQWALSEILTDHEFLSEYLTENVRRLASAYKRITTLFDSEDIPHVHAEAGFFLLLDLRRFLDGDEASREGEMRLYRRLAYARVLVTPCCEAFSTTYGLFRVCYGAVAEDTLDEAWNRIRSVLFPKD